MSGFLPGTIKTHAETKEPQIDLRHLADYMAASRQAQRGIVRDCKYRRIARVVQHTEARAVIFNHIRSRTIGPDDLKNKAEQIRNRLADDEFEADVNDHNADYIDRFAGNLLKIALPACQIMPPRAVEPIEISGVFVRFGPHVLLRRTMKRTNRQRSGAIMLRYAKGEALPPKAAQWQTASIFGFLRTIQEAEAAEPERPLCVVVDAHAGVVHSAPGDSVYRFNEMKAACADIAERWPNIQPPPNAII
jgi:hypothetical protein